MAGVLITGGAGFIGCNLAHRLLGEGHRVTLFDNLSRPGNRENLQWLHSIHGHRAFRLVEADVRDYETLRRAALGVDRIYHLAGQVAVTSSVRDPRADFEANALGTFNALEAARASGADPVFVYSSTNKVYGDIGGEPVVSRPTRYEHVRLQRGVSEARPLDLQSPYACSKGAGDQYVRDYHRIYGLRTVVFRQSCIYGYRQFGVEDQGWVAWLMFASLAGLPITIYGDGKQVRDLLFIDDLLDAYEAGIGRIDRSAGQIYNVGGGVRNTISIWAEFGAMLERLIGRPIRVEHVDWRPGDQLVYISDIRKARRELGWSPKVSLSRGLDLMLDWIRQQQAALERLHEPKGHLRGPVESPTAVTGAAQPCRTPS